MVFDKFKVYNPNICNLNIQTREAEPSQSLVLLLGKMVFPSVEGLLFKGIIDILGQLGMESYICFELLFSYSLMLRKKKNRG